MKRKIVSITVMTILLLVISTKNIFAHVVVKPAQAGVGQSLNFTMSVPSEKTMPTTAVRLVLPEGLTSVRPLVKPGWKIEIKKSGEEDTARVTEINWTGGAIPSDQKDEFVVSAKVPAEATTLIWKAYQTYADGSVVTWDQAPSTEQGKDDDDKAGPYSQTKIVNDLDSPEPTVSRIKGANSMMQNYLSYTALTLSIVSLVLTLRKNK